MVEETPSYSFQTELVGREEEMERLKKVFDEVRNGNGETIFISGEAGIGKTRLVEEFERALSDEVKFLKGKCINESMEPLLPFREAFRNGEVEHLISADPPPKVISTYLIDDAGLLISESERERSDLEADIFAPMMDTVESFVNDSLSEMGRKDGSEKGLNTIGYGDYNILVQSGERFSLVALIEGAKNEILIDDMRKKLSEAENKLRSWDGNILEAEKVEEYVSWFTNTDKYQGEYLVDDPEIKQENLFENVLLGLKRLTYEKPVILFLDDLQWADPTTLSLSHYLSRNTKDDEILIIGTYRPEDIINDEDGKEHLLKTTKQNMSREGLYQEIDLKRLTRTNSERIINSILGEVEIEDDFLKRVYDKAEGNPFFILEIVKFLVEEGHLTENEEGWVLDKNIVSIELPVRLNELISRRVERLLEDQRKILFCGSVEGEKFSSTIIEEILDLERLEILQQLNKIENKHELIRSLEDGYEFEHKSVREILYQDMNVELRKEYHKRIAETYEKELEEESDENLELIARHYHKAEDKRAIQYLLEAAGRSKDSYANREGITFYQKVLSLVDEEGSEELAEIYRGLGELYGVTGEYDKALENYKKLKKMTDDQKIKAEVCGKIAGIYRDVGEYERSLEYVDKGLDLLFEDEGLRSELLKVKGWALIRQGENDRAEKALKEGEELTGQIGDKKERGNIHLALGALYYHRSEYERSEHHLKEAVEIFKKIEDIKQLSASYNNLALIYSARNEPDRSLDYHEKSLEMSEEIGRKRTIAISLNNMGNLYLDLGQIDKALENHEKSLGIKKEIGDRLGIATSLNNIGDIYLTRGRLDKALEKEERALDLSGEIGYKKGSSIALHNIGEIHLKKGELGKASKYYHESLELNEDLGRKKGKVITLSRLTEVYIREDELAKAKEDAEKALDISREIDSRVDKGKAKRALGMVYRELGEWEKGVGIFKDAIEIFEDSDSKRDLSKIYFEYGVLLKRKGECEDAQEYLGSALDIFKDMGMEIWEDKAERALKEIQVYSQ